ncbi:MAG: hypothetical protein C5B50_07805 [Verrucomicrobia bacterium]|nr:MAG: hypothetical protein C5B50_07805 [Verrucomicrobiota bacterium]
MPESWTTFTDLDVLPATSAERIGIAAIKGRDDLAAICLGVTAQIRQAYEFSERDLGPEGQIPEGLKGRAIAIALWRFVSEGVAKNEAVQTRQREAAYEEAVDYLEKVGQAKIGRVSGPAVGRRRHRFGVEREEGI